MRFGSNCSVTHFSWCEEQLKLWFTDIGKEFLLQLAGQTYLERWQTVDTRNVYPLTGGAEQKKKTENTFVVQLSFALTDSNKSDKKNC